MKFSKEKFYIITRERAEYGRRGQYELSTADGKDHCFFMDDTLGYEYFPVDSKIKEDAPTKKVRKR
jgi:hypothetical protein